MARGFIVGIPAIGGPETKDQRAHSVRAGHLEAGNVFEKVPQCFAEEILR